jgi:hypothetical protein
VPDAPADNMAARSNARAALCLSESGTVGSNSCCGMGRDTSAFVSVFVSSRIGTAIAKGSSANRRLMNLLQTKKEREVASHIDPNGWA